MSDCGCNIEIRDKQQRRVLIPLLLINGLMFFIGFVISMIVMSCGISILRDADAEKAHLFSESDTMLDSLF